MITRRALIGATALAPLVARSGIAKRVGAGAVSPQSRLKLISYGDSITAGTGASILSLSYAALISSEEGFVTTVNNAVSGTFLPQIYSQQVFAAGYVPGVSDGYTVTVMAGTNDGYHSGDSGYDPNYAFTYQMAMMGGVAWIAMPSTQKIYATAGTTTGAGWHADLETLLPPGLSLSNNVLGDTISFTITVPNTIAYIWYMFGNGETGQFTYSVDGGAQSSPVSSAPPATMYAYTWGVPLVRITGLSVGSHTIRITNASSSGAKIYILAVGAPSPSSACFVLASGVIKETDPTRGPAMNAYNQSVVSTLRGDGVTGVQFVDVDAAMLAPPDYSDMADFLHPNDLGHREIANAFEALIH